ncbi:MAG: hypothetical protein KBF88_10915 [Polyangiaceae bacterium]|nr:hypothetical protein [Polyangiaceae bacterium]
MCRRVECEQCKKPTYAGCGMHVEQVLGNVPKDSRCVCREKKTTAKAGEPQQASMFQKLFGLGR